MYLSNSETKILTSQHFRGHPWRGQPKNDCPPPRVRGLPHEVGGEEKAPPRPGSFLQRSTEILSHTLALLCQVKGPKRHKRAINHFSCLEKTTGHGQLPSKDLLANTSTKGGCQVIRGRHAQEAWSNSGWPYVVHRTPHL